MNQNTDKILEQKNQNNKDSDFYSATIEIRVKPKFSLFFSRANCFYLTNTFFVYGKIHKKMKISHAKKEIKSFLRKHIAGKISPEDFKKARILIHFVENEEKIKEEKKVLYITSEGCYIQ